MRPEPFDKLRTAPVEVRASTSAAHVPGDSATLLAHFSERLRNEGVAVTQDRR